MRSAPALADSSNTRREPSTFSSCEASPASRIANARCTTTWAPLTRSRTLAASVTSPRRYSGLRQPRSPGSDGRRAMPITRLTARDRSRASTMPRPRSPVGPVTATVRPVLVTGAVLQDSSAACAAFFLAADQDVGPVRDHGVEARAAPDPVRPLVAHLDHVVAGPRIDRIRPVASDDQVVVGPGANAVEAGTTVDGRASADRADDVVAGAGADRHVAVVGVHAVRTGAGGDEVVTDAGVDRVGVGAAEQPIAAGLAEQDVLAGAAQQEVVARARVDDVVAGAGVDVVVPGPADREVDSVSALDAVAAGAGLEVVVRAQPGEPVLAVLPVELVRGGRAHEVVGAAGADLSRGERDRACGAEQRERRDDCDCAALHRLQQQAAAPLVALIPPARSRVLPAAAPRRSRRARPRAAAPGPPRACGPCRAPRPPKPSPRAPRGA